MSDSAATLLVRAITAAAGEFDRAGTASLSADRPGLTLALRATMLFASGSPISTRLVKELHKRAASRVPAVFTDCLQSFGGGKPNRPWAAIDARPLNATQLRAALRQLHESLRHPTPAELSDAYEQILAGSDRKSRGAYYTPDPIVAAILDDTLGERGMPAVCDPACGSGRFIVEAARRLLRRAGSRSPAWVIREHVFGVDLDRCAAELCAYALWVLAGDRSLAVAEAAPGIRIGDSLLSPPGAIDSGFSWTRECPRVFAKGGFDAVVGNPPFLGQLKAETVTSRTRAATLAEWSDGTISGYADEATAFLLLATRITKPGGRVCLIQPLSLLAAEGAHAVRRETLRVGSLTGIWLSERHAFPGVGVHTCAPLLTIGRKAKARIARRLGPDAESAARSTYRSNELAREETWSSLLAESLGVPTFTMTSKGTLADLAHATADFRDQYYGLSGCIYESIERDPDTRVGPRLITSGHIEPAESLWGIEPCRALKQKWLRPRVRVQSLPNELRRWASDRLVPKLLMATQTRTPECFADFEGVCLPCVPVITITPRRPVRATQTLGVLGALLSSPVLAAIAMRRHAGAALSPHALKLSASDLLALPLPARTASTARSLKAAAESWLLACAARTQTDRHIHLLAAATSTLAAYRVLKAERPALLEWWRQLAIR